MEVQFDFSMCMYTALAFLIPFGVFKVNQWLYKNGDPAWKKAEQKREQGQQGQQQGTATAKERQGQQQ